MEIFRNECKFNFITHLLFPARSMIKELIYWPTELAAAVIFVIYIIQMNLTVVTLYDGKDETTPVQTMAITILEDDKLIPFVDSQLMGISLARNWFTIQQLDTDLLNREYAWICLCYMIKHFLYFIDVAMLLRRKRCKLWDFVTPFLNCGLWVCWGVFGWLSANIEVHGGMYLRYQKDYIFNTDLSNSTRIETATNQYAMAREKYDKNKTFQWLWIVCLCVTVINAAMWILGLVMRRSSAYTGQAFSVVAIPAQLLILHLFLKGAWIKSNYTSLFTDFTTADRARISCNADYFEARWVFLIIYLAGWGGIACGLACLIRAIYAFVSQKEAIKGIKYICYFIFWGSAFLWIIFLDNTLYHYFVEWKTGLIITQIICMVFAVFIWVLSFLEKKKEGDKFITRHDNWCNWWYSTDGCCNNMADAAYLGKSASQQPYNNQLYPNQPSHPTQQPGNQVATYPNDSKPVNHQSDSYNAHPSNTQQNSQGTQNQLNSQPYQGGSSGRGRPYRK